MEWALIALAVVVVVFGLLALTVYTHWEVIKSVWEAEMRSVQEHKRRKR